VSQEVRYIPWWRTVTLLAFQLKVHLHEAGVSFPELVACLPSSHREMYDVAKLKLAEVSWNNLSRHEEWHHFRFDRAVKESGGEIRYWGRSMKTDTYIRFVTAELVLTVCQSLEIGELLERWHRGQAFARREHTCMTWTSTLHLWGQSCPAWRWARLSWIHGYTRSQLRNVRLEQSVI
jgi:hypothetical protein